ncbi:unnamed protein product [Didymodactylos carnosus]|uniref:Oligopeptide transporter n=1 Tax=Didymodactylos carnosus TaxID=1234261 RepID=A0A814ZZF5_9BILA|nr:unnamed protein product [Didymodactylos carnosus]CAF1250226.1 unnamed protein product [Didymodactylos carnosus]CAF3817023.1 unnamed protein product [Didymodactylos carnosus]CAF4019056.1 unnamed protein product [Didymodactylos carnosus]
MNDQHSLPSISETSNNLPMNPIYPATVLPDIQIQSNYIDSEQSSYEEIAGIIPNKDDPDMLCFTFRSFSIGLCCIVLICTVDRFFIYRTKQYNIPLSFLLLFVYAIGILMAKCLPGKHLKWKNISLNSGQFSVKEHAIIFIMMLISSRSTDAIDIIVVKSAYLDQNTPFVWGFLFVLSAQSMGYGTAGVLRRFLVWPPAMVWPSNLPVISLLRTLHEKETTTTIRWLNLTRIKFFFLILSFQAIYYWFPGFIMPVLCAFSWMCMIKPKSLVLAQLTGFDGLGMGTVVFDWKTLTSSLGSPILVPRYAAINMLIGFVVFIWVVVPIMYYTNLWGFQMIPIAATTFFASDGGIINSNFKEMMKNHTLLKMHEPILFDSTITVSYFAFFGCFTALLVYTILYHSKDLLQQLHTTLKKRENDIHCTLMSKYSEAKEWWYVLVFIISFIICGISCHFGQFMPWYYLFFTTLVAFVCILPIGIVQATTNISIDVAIIAQLLGASLFRGDIVSTYTFMTCTNQLVVESVAFARILKFGHYLKISARTLFFVQLFTTIISALLRYGITTYLLSTISNFCDIDGNWGCTKINRNNLIISALGITDFYYMLGCAIVN